jgi:hypothetical protein
MADNQATSSELVHGFWRWFAEHAAELHELMPGAQLWDEFERRLRSFDISNWEIGPALREKGKSMLALSPAGCLNRLHRIDELVRLAPDIPGWEVYAGKPPKCWERRFEWSSKRIAIDASNWRLSIYRYNDGLFELALLNPGMKSLSDDERERIATFVVESEIGERSFMSYIYRVSIEDKPTAEQIQNAIGISELRETIEARHAADIA